MLSSFAMTSVRAQEQDSVLRILLAGIEEDCISRPEVSEPRGDDGMHRPEHETCVHSEKP